MSRDRRYQKLLNAKEWKMLREYKLAKNPLCERCQRMGYVRSAVDVHHIVPVESGRTEDEMRNLCYRWSNLQSLCVQCHIEVHKAEKSHTKEAHLKREADRLERWKEKHNKKYGL